jgi:putative MATE family efflux protein
MKKEVNMLSGSIAKTLLAIALPIMVMNVLQSIFNLIDSTILKMYDTSGGYAVGAVGVCSTLIVLITQLVTGISTGSNVVVAKALGKNDQEQVERAIGVSLLFSLVGGIFLLIVGLSCATLFLRWTNCSEILLPQASLYFRLYFLAGPLIIMYNFCAVILRASGDTRRPMIFLTIGGIVKVLFTLLFVAVFKMQIVGVALATIISWVVSFALVFIALLRNEGVVKIKFSRIRFYKEEFKAILMVGIPTALQQSFFAIPNVVISSAVNTFGPDATTGISIANTFDGILYNICLAPSLAIMPFISQNLGANNLKRATKSISSGIFITIIIGVTFGALSAIFSAQLSSLMADSPAIIAYSRQKMIIISSTYFICGINDLLTAAMRSMGKPITATVCGFIFLCVLRFVWVYFIFPLLPTLTFLYLVWPIGWALSIIVLTLFVLHRIKQLKRESTLS